MKKALIISYYYPPCHGSAPWRPYSWATYFKQFGIAPVVITRHWDGNEHNWHDYIKDVDKPIEHKITDENELYLLPAKKSKWYSLLFSNNKLLQLIQPVIYYSYLIAGIFNVEIDAYYSFKEFVAKHLKEYSYDFIILTIPPSNILKLIPVIRQNSTAKIVADFRDIWDNLEPSPNYKPTFKRGFSNYISKIYLRNWLKHVDLITHVTPPFGEILNKVSDKPKSIIYNGYDEEFFKNKPRLRNERFTFSMIGSLYPQQDISLMIIGLQIFLKDKDAEKINLIFIGLDENPQTSKILMESIPSSFLTLSKRLKKEDAIAATIQSDVLFYPAWKGYKGIIGVKPLDYIASGNNILIAPGDNDIVDELILKTHTGKIANSVDEFVLILNAWYKEWEQFGVLKYNGLKSEIEFYSRKTQAEIFAQQLLQLLKDKG